MEFWELSRLTGDPSFSDAAMKVTQPGSCWHRSFQDRVVPGGAMGTLSPLVACQKLQGPAQCFVFWAQGLKCSLEIRAPRMRLKLHA